MKLELVSVVIPVYNVERYVEECIISIINQTYKLIEIIIIDDGSTDRSGYICEAYSAKDDRIHVIHQANMGLSFSRNAGVRICKGNYIIFVDSDDFINPNYIMEMYLALKKTDSDLVCCETIKFVERHSKKVFEYWEQLELQETKTVVFSPLKFLPDVLYQKISATGAQQKMYSRKLFMKIHFPEGKYYEDLATTYQFILCSDKIAFIDKKLYAYRIQKNSIMNQRFSQKKLDCIWVSGKLFQEISDRCPQFIFPAACAAFRVNRIVYGQLSLLDKENVQKVWYEIVKYRNYVMKDKDVQFYERVLATLSYGGKIFFYICVKFFLLLRKINILISCK